MYEPCAFNEQPLFEDCLVDRQFDLDHDRFRDQGLWIADHDISHASAENTLPTMPDPVNQWPFADVQPGVFMFEHTPMATESEPLPGDRRVSSSSTESSGDDSVFVGDGFDLPLIYSLPSTTEISGGVGSKYRWDCAECNQLFPTSQKLEDHARAYTHLAYRCKDCGKGFSRRDTFGRHVATHKTSGASHTCEICKRQNKINVFKRKDHLEQHKRNRHTETSKSIMSRMHGAVSNVAQFTCD